MSWTRTALALLVCSMVMLRWSPSYPAAVFVVVAVLALVALVLFAVNRRFYRRDAQHLARERATPNTLAVLAMASAMLVFGAGGVALVLLHQA